MLAALLRGEIPPNVFLQSVVAGAAACAAAHSGSSPIAAAAAGEAAAASMAGMTGNADENWASASAAGAAAAAAFSAPGASADATAAGAGLGARVGLRAAGSGAAYKLALIDEDATTCVQQWNLGVSASRAISGGDTAEVAQEVSVYLDEAFSESNLAKIYHAKKHSDMLACSDSAGSLLLEDAAEVAVSAAVQMHMSKATHSVGGGDGSCVLQ